LSGFVVMRTRTGAVDRPWLYYITDRKQLPPGGLIAAVRRALRCGVDFVQVREKDLPDRDLYGLVRKIVAAAHAAGRLALVNGRADIALAAGADGVHLPASGLRPDDIRSWVPASFLVGVSVHSLHEARRAERLGADYILAGPVYPTPSKLRFGKPLGPLALSRICRTVDIPVFALGGIHAQHIRQVVAAGAAGIAGITLFQREYTLLNDALLTAPDR
jgi:thiamine-phosphate pyrophosphorylase